MQMLDRASGGNQHAHSRQWQQIGTIVTWVTLSTRLAREVGRTTPHACSDACFKLQHLVLEVQARWFESSKISKEAMRD